MTGYSTPTVPGGLVAQEPGRIGGAARGWPGLGRLLADRWGGEGPHDIVRLWVEAQAAAGLPLGVRVRAATAADPLAR